MMRRFVIWSLAGIASAMLTVAAFFPAAWMAPLAEWQTGGRLTLGEAQGTLWRGSAFVAGTPDEGEPATPLLPGRFTWRLSPALLLGQVDAELENDAALSHPVRVNGNWRQWQIGPAAILFPAERLAALGAPLNTVQPSGRMRLSWEQLRLVRQDGKIEMTGAMNLEMRDIASRLSPVRPLGTYNLAFDWHGRGASVALETASGPMLLSGSGTLAGGRLEFAGKAEAEAGQEEKLANLLNLLGQRRREGDRNVIALELK